MLDAQAAWEEEAPTVVLWGRTCECADLMTLLRVDVLVYVACVEVCVCVCARARVNISPLTPHCLFCCCSATNHNAFS